MNKCRFIFTSLVTLLLYILFASAGQSEGWMQTAHASTSRANNRSDKIIPETSEYIYMPIVMKAREQILIPAGVFQMGCNPNHNDGYECSSDELPLHTVYLSAYYIDKYEVTNLQFKTCVSAGGCTPPLNSSSNTQVDYYGNPTFWNFPVIWVDWHQAQAFCEWTGGRLPTEAEWEKAARGNTDTRAYPWGDTSPTCDLVNAYLYGYCVGDTTEVGSYPGGANLYGLADFAGNVWEWVNDWYQPYYYNISPNIDPQGPNDGDTKVYRGGSWSDFDYWLRVAERGGTGPEASSSNLGFRCARTP